MQVTLLDSSIYVHPRLPVELVISVDGTAMRVAIEWRAVERMMGAPTTDETQVRTFLQRHRGEIGRQLRAQLVARGVPLSRKLTVFEEDVGPVGVPSGRGGATLGARSPAVAYSLAPPH